MNQSETFRVLGIQHQNAPISVREAFSISEQDIQSICKIATSQNDGGFMILSTCNRTEIWSHGHEEDYLKQVFLEHCEGDAELFDRYAFHHRGEEAIKHIFHVACGLDSQILGDIQIQSQIKKAVSVAQEENALNAELNRLIQMSLRYSKRIKNETDISSGAASVAYAAVQYITEKSKNLSDKKVLLYGTGKMGTLTCKNLAKHISSENLFLINRTAENAMKLASVTGGSFVEQKRLTEILNIADIVIIATSSASPTLMLETYNKLYKKDRILIDLAVPRNIDPRIESSDLATIADVDDLSKMQDEALRKRKESVPKAEQIISEGMEEFREWLQLRHLSPTFEAIKNRLQDFKNEEIEFHKNRLNQADLELLNTLTGRMMDKLARQMINHLKENHASASDPINTLSSILELKK